MSQVNAATTAPVTVMYSSAFTTIGSMTPISMGLAAALCHCDVILPPPVIPRDNKGVIGLTTVLQQQPLSQMTSKAYANYAMGHP